MKNNTVYFDSYCNLCSGIVRWLSGIDKRHNLCFPTLESFGTAEELTEISQKDIPDSIIFYSQGITYIKSSAVLHIMKAIGGPWSLLYAGIYIPKILRDFMYDFIAGNRYRWFGRQSRCMIPGNESKDRNT